MLVISDLHHRAAVKAMLAAHFSDEGTVALWGDLVTQWVRESTWSEKADPGQSKTPQLISDELASGEYLDLCQATHSRSCL